MERRGLWNLVQCRSVELTWSHCCYWDGYWGSHCCCSYLNLMVMTESDWASRVSYEASLQRFLSTRSWRRTLGRRWPGITVQNEITFTVLIVGNLMKVSPNSYVLTFQLFKWLEWLTQMPTGLLPHYSIVTFFTHCDNIRHCRKQSSSFIIKLTVYSFLNSSTHFIKLCTILEGIYRPSWLFPQDIITLVWLWQ